MVDRSLRWTASAAPTLDFGIYGQLLGTLMPAADFIALSRGDVYAPWYSCIAPAADLLAAARRALDAPAATPCDVTGERVAVGDDGRALNVLTLRDAGGSVMAVVASRHRSFFSERPVAEVLALLRPALECLSRELLAKTMYGGVERRASPPQSGAPALLDLAEQERGLVCNGYEVGRFVDAALKKLGCLTATLIVPEKNIAVVRRRAGAAPRGASEYVTRSHRHLMAWAVQQGRPLVVNDPASSPRLPPCRILSVRLRATSGRVTGFLAFLNELSAPPFGPEHVQVAELLAERMESILQRNYDSLTGLATRAAFERDAEIMIGRAGTTLPCSAIYVDIDGMGLINERFSMPVGDAVISEVASILQHQMPRTALAARLAGDRYAVLVPGADVTGALALAQTVARAITEITGTSADGAVRVSVSIGVAAVEPSSPQPLAHALAAAEQASKRSKRAQRPAGDKVGAASSASSEACVDEVSVADLRAWLEADRFELHAQPILALSDATTEPRFEILLRGLSADGVPLTPGKLIAAAEGHGLMPAIDSWVIEKAFAMLGLQRQVLTTRSARFSINLSRQSLADDTVPALIEQAWRRSGVPADLVCFEIAEAAVLAAPERAVRTLHRLRRLGFQTALDDAGSARLTTNQVTALPLDVIKLDGALVRRAIVDADAAGVLAEMITHAGGLRRITVANGVETDDQRRLLSGMGADYGQGFVIGRPGVLVSVLRDVAMYAQIDAGTRAKVREQ